MEHATVNCFYREDIFIESDSENIVLNENEVHVWIGDVTKADIFRLQQTLDHSEIEKSLKYYHEADKTKHIARRGSLRITLAKYLKVDPREIRFTLDDNKKPFAENIHFNVAHSGDRFVIAVSAVPVGADIEEINDEFDFTEITDHHFSDKEKDYIEKSAEPVKAFFLLWTRKEALIKATSKGITDDLKSTPCFGENNEVSAEIIGAGGNWNVASFNMYGKYIASIASRSRIEKLSFYAGIGSHFK